MSCLFCQNLSKCYRLIVTPLSSLIEMQEKPIPMWLQCIEIAVLNSQYSTVQSTTVLSLCTDVYQYTRTKIITSVLRVLPRVHQVVVAKKTENLEPRRFEFGYLAFKVTDLTTDQVYHQHKNVVKLPRESYCYTGLYKGACYVQNGGHSWPPPTRGGWSRYLMNAHSWWCQYI